MLGCSGAVVVLLVAVLVFAVARYRDPLVTVPDAVPRSVLIRNVRVIDVMEGTARESMDVLVEGGIITHITAHPSSHVAKETIDAEGMSLIPGLIDIHCHLIGQSTPPWDLSLPDIDAHLERHLYSGVTRVFDPGAAPSEIFPLRQEVNSGQRLGPTIYAAGPMFTAPGGHPIPMVEHHAPSLLVGTIVEQVARQVENAEDARAALDALQPDSPDFIKVAIDRLPPSAPTLDLAAARALVREADSRGLRTVAHIGTTRDALDAGRAGVAAWLHGVYKERIPDSAIAELAAFNIPMAPTLVVFESFGNMGRGSFASTALERELAPADLLDARVTAPPDWDWGGGSFAELITTMREQRQDALENVRRLAEAGVVILAGSDAQSGVIHGASLHRELDLLFEAGLTPIDVLRAATVNNARFLAGKRDVDFGVIGVGMRADIVLVRGNPLTDVSAIHAIEQVLLEGVVLQRHPVDS